MSDVKGRLKDILNTTLGGQSRQKTHEGFSKERSYASTNDYKALNDSIYNLKKRKSNLSRNDSICNSSILNKSHGAFTATQTYTSSKDRKKSTYTKLNNLSLISPKTESTLYFSKFSSNKIIRVIEDLHKEITKEGISREGFRNRPMLNLNRPELVFKSSDYYTSSPTLTRKSFLTTSNVFKNYKSNSKYNTNSDFNCNFQKKKENKLEILLKELQITNKSVISSHNRRQTFY